MKELKKLFENNQAWVEKQLRSDPHFFKTLEEGQAPKYLWIGCSDSRVPAEQILGLNPGELFVHRNIGNQFVPSDLNSQSVLQFSVDYLNIDHIIVCGHYLCGAVMAAIQEKQDDAVSQWIEPIREISTKENERLKAISDPGERTRFLVELNVLRQVYNICNTQIVKKAWDNNVKLTVHGWVYDISTGLLKDLECCISNNEHLKKVFDRSNKEWTDK